MNVPFQLSTKLGPDLKEMPMERDQFEKAREYFLDEIAAKESWQPEDLRGRYSLLGFICRMIDRPIESLEYAKKAVELSSQINIILYLVIDQMRLANSLHGAGSTDEAIELFEDTIRVCEALPALGEVVDFAYQYYGKLLFDLKDYPKSLLYFEKARNVREEKGIAELTERTRFAIQILKNKVSQH